ncbi:MAG: TniQ family protein [Devosia sp.]
MSAVPFPLRVDHQPDEPAHGLLLRTAAHNGTRRYHPLFVRFGVRHSFLANNVDPLSVAAACSADPVAVASASPVTTPKTVDLLGQRMHRDHYSVYRRRWCPECLKEAPYHRAWWDVVAITTCPTHKVELVTECGCSKRATWQSFGITHCRAGHDLRDASAAAVDDDELVVDRYLVSRLTGVDHVRHPHLDGMDFGEVVFLLERLGKAWHDGADLRRLRSDIGARKLLVAGYQVVTDFPAGFRSLLDRMVQRAVDRKGDWGINKLYGDFYYWVQELPRSALADALRAEITDHIEANTILKTGTKLFDGREINNSYTLDEAAAIVGVAQGKLRRMAIELGMLEAEKRPGQPARLDRGRIHEIAALFRGSKTMQDVAGELGVGVDVVHSLVKDGLLTPLLRAGQSGLNNYDFPASAAADLLARLDALPITDAPDDQRKVALPVAAQQARITVARGMALVLDGSVAIVGIDQSATGLQRYRVSASSIVRAARQEVKPGLTVTAAAERLGLPYNATMDFVKRGVIETIIEGKARYVTEGEIARFQETYVAVPELSAILGIKRSRDTIARMAGAGVEPACPRPPYWKVLYWRDEAVAAAGSIVAAQY